MRNRPQSSCQATLTCGFLSLLSGLTEGWSLQALRGVTKAGYQSGWGQGNSPAVQALGEVGLGQYRPESSCCSSFRPKASDLSSGLPALDS